MRVERQPSEWQQLRLMQLIPAKAQPQVMDTETPARSFFKERSQVDNSRVSLARKEPEDIPDRKLVYSEIGITVRVLSRQSNNLLPGKTYFLSPDSKIVELCKRLREEFKIMASDYYLHFYSLRLDETKRFSELGFVSGDEFWYGPTFCNPYAGEPHPRLTHYIQNFLHKASHITRGGEKFKMSGNEFTLSPSLPVILRMEFYDLGNVSNFQIYNSNGSIRFLQPVDLRGIDLSDVVKIEKGLIEVYPENTPKPPPGHGLNVPAEIHFLGLKSLKCRSPQAFEEKLKRWVEGIPNSRLESIDTAKGELVIRVNHF